MITCPPSQCCSEHGYCGVTSEHCNEKCQAEFGTCGGNDEGSGDTNEPVPSDFVIYETCSTPGEIALTFDDGPQRENTEKILKILKDKSVVATFFVLGDQITGESSGDNTTDLLKRIYEEGHVLAIHDTTHDDLTYFSADDVAERMRTMKKLIKDAIGFTPKFMRAPYGSIDKAAAEGIKDEGLLAVDWDYDSIDWQLRDKNENLQYLQTELLDKKDPKSDGIIALYHDIWPETADSVAEIIDEIVSAKFKFVPIHKCLDIDGPYMES